MRLLPSTSILFLLSFLVHLIFLHPNTAQTDPTETICLDNERDALLEFKLSFVADPIGSLASWNIHSDEDCCNWDGVTCNYQSRHVVELELGAGLKSYQLHPSLLVLQHLTSLDLSYNVFPMRIPNFLGSLSKLTDLDLSQSGFFGEVPPHLGNLSNMDSLHLGPSNLLCANSLQWLSPLSSLQILDLSDVNVSNAVDWASTLKMLPSLSEFTCTSCSLPLPPLSSISYVNSTSITSLDLSNNSVSPSTFSSFINGSNQLSKVHLNQMQLEQYNLDGFLEALTNMARFSLRELSLVGNNLKKLSFGGERFPSLKHLYVSFNLLNELFLQELVALPSLTSVDVSFNIINSSFPRVLHHLSANSTHLDFSSNFIHGVITDSHLSKFSHLKALKLSNNDLLVFNFSENWIPPFQLGKLQLRSCRIGTTFPKWILTQQILFHLDISNSNISGTIPDSFWRNSTRLSYLNVSYNTITGKIPDSLHFLLPYDDDQPVTLDLSNNAFYGTIPLFLFTSDTLDLSHNKFSKIPPVLRSLFNHTPSQINLSNNLLSGLLPNWLFQFEDPVQLNLENNMLSGTIPREIGSLWHLCVLHLSNNNFSGQLPSSMKNCTYLNILELASNSFSGVVPSWIGESMPYLIVLNLRSNNFFGYLPSTLCHLQKLQIFDLSENQIFGPIPRCIHNFTVMSTDKGLGLMGVISEKLAFSYENGYIVAVDYASVTWKGVRTDIYSHNLDQRSVINLSGNMLRGEIPIEVTTLKGLRSLDLSRNGLAGSIPDKIGQMKFLELLNLSSNRLSGELPESLADLTFLSIFNVSNNNLSGRIPSSTQLRDFDASSYAGNPELCGEPVSINCPGDIDDDGDDDATRQSNKESFDIQAFLAASGSGFAFGLLGVIGMMHYNRRFRVAFFQSVHNIVETIVVTICVYQSRIKRSLFSNKEDGATEREG